MDNSSTPNSPIAGPQFARWVAAACGLLSILTFALFAQCTTFRFISYDDPSYVAKNPLVQQGITPSLFVWIWTTPVGANWHPLTVVSHALDCQVFGTEPAGHHLTNVLLHSLTCGLLGWTLWRLSGHLSASLLAAALWAWHPLRVESVAWVSERKDVLSGLLWTIGLWQYARYARGAGRGAYLALLVVYGLAVLAKPSVLTFPFVLLLLDFWPLERTVWPTNTARVQHLLRLVGEKLPLFAMTVAGAVFTYIFQRGEGAFYERLSPGFRVANALNSVVMYLQQSVWPVDLFLPHLLLDRIEQQPSLALYAAIVGAITLAAIAAAWRLRYLPVGWLWFLGTLVPMIGLVQVGQQSMADRYTYLPHIGLFWALASLAVDIGRRLAGRAGIAVVGAAGGATALILAATTWHQLGYWSDSLTLYAHTLALDPDNSEGLAMYGMAQFKLNNNLSEARQKYLEGLRREPFNAACHFGLGELCLRDTRLELAVYHFQHARQTPVAQAYQAEALSLLGYRDAAVELVNAALAKEPQMLTELAELIAALNRSDRTREMMARLEQASRDRPDDPIVLNRLARLLATYPKAELRDAERAVRLARTACRLTGEAHPAMLDTRAAALAAVGQFASANASLEKAIRICQEKSQSGCVEAQAWREFIAPHQALFRRREVLLETPGTVEFLVVSREFCEPGAVLLE